MTHHPLRRRYALLAGALVTLLIMGLDLADPDAAIPSTLRSAGATVTGPLLTAVADTFPEPPDHAVDLAQTGARLALTESEVRRLGGIVDLSTSPTLAAATDSPTDTAPQAAGIVTARVVGIGTPAATGPQRLTIDVGSRDGIATDQTVLNHQGLVGRTVRVGTTTADVLVLGAQDLVVGARTDSGLLGTVGPPTPADGARDPGQLTFSAIAIADLEPGELLTTVGSPDATPFVAGIPVGTVVSVDPGTGRLGPTAAIRPAADIARLDVVGVVVPTPGEDGG
ncbi:MAG: rod shape-determining protein MreC [Dermatophilaceae bacterium]